MNGARIFALVIILATVGWIGSGMLTHNGSANQGPAAPRLDRAEPKLFRVAVQPVTVEEKRRRIFLSGNTEADRRVMATSRANGIVVALKLRQGARVEAGDVIALLSDEAREAAVAQAKARLEQRIAEWKARERLIASGTMAAINRPQLEAEVKAAEAGLALVEAERDRARIVAPIRGIINQVPVEIGQAVSPGQGVAEVIGLDPILAVAEISERRLSAIKVGDKAKIRLVTGEEVAGEIRFISNRASPQTRTYRIEISIPNPERTIRDGVTCEVALMLPPVEAARVPRSALTFSSEGRLGVRVVRDGQVAFMPVALVEDTSDAVWVTGLAAGLQVIVQGQDFVREGQKVDTVVLPNA